MLTFDKATLSKVRGAQVEPPKLCPKCLPFEVLDLSREARATVAEIARTKSRLDAMLWLARIAGHPLYESKALALHLTHTRGQCHRCTAALPELEQSNCPNCGSLNLDW